MVERFTGETPLRFLAVKNWDNRRSAQISKIIENRMEEINTWQRRLLRLNSNF